MGNYDEPELPGHTGRSTWALVLIGVLVLLVGGGAGYALRALTTTESASPTSAAAPPAGPAPAPSTPSAPVATTCTAAAEAGAAITEQVRRGVDAIRNLDPAALRAVLDRIQPLQRELERAVRACSTVPPAPTPSGGPGG